MKNKYFDQMFRFYVLNVSILIWNKVKNVISQHLYLDKVEESDDET